MIARAERLNGRAVWTTLSSPRSIGILGVGLAIVGSWLALPPATLLSLSERVGGPPGELAPAARPAVERARDIAGPGGAVVVTGSIYLIAALVRDERALRASSM